MSHNTSNSFLNLRSHRTNLFPRNVSAMCFIVFYISLFPFFLGFWKRKKILFLSLVPVKSFQKTFQRKFLGSVTSSRSEVVRSSQNPPSHPPEWGKFLTTLAPCSSGRPAYEACCRSKTHEKAQAQNWVMPGESEVLSISLPCSEQAVKASCNVRQ